MVFRPNIYGDTLQWIFADTHSQQSTTISVVDTPVQLNRTTDLTTGEQKNMTIDADGVITSKVAGIFILQYHCSFSGASNDEFTMYWRINSTNQTSGKTKWTMKGGDYWAISSQTMINLQEGDTIDLYIENNTDTSNITLENFNQTIFKISSSPTTFLFSPAPPETFSNVYSLDFDGADDKLLMGDATFDVGSYAIWIKTTETGGAIIMQKDAGWYFYYNSGKMKVQHPMINGTLNSTTLINDDSWHFLVVTCAGGSGVSSEVKFYLDGILETTKAGPDPPNSYTPVTDALSVAYSDVWGGYYFDGNLDEPSFWTNILTSDEVTALYNSGKPIALDADAGDYTSSATLQHWWRMGDPDGTSEYPTIEDVAGSLDGTMINMVDSDITEDVPS